ncbi:unnamed protein product [Kluyveromyces dobzhanskii CBS 2104]|uniref:WGS project CCBQ000000000 data, contig 00009 n=1 Tax=Kluyveromyces dobzhanskii CBS 2104 TaxID=1427455 RepID=A0A0A8L5B8_9SACH|nr:unnamed protein product [Kluyveromyces dobzhanskii CBS 2104]
MTTPKTIRLQCRDQILTSHTSGLAPAYLQANLLILPAAYAEDFSRLCRRNPVPCPLLAVTDGTPKKLNNGILVDSSSEQGFDIRTDFPRYHIYNKGKLQTKSNDCVEEWKDGHVGFLIGCSYSFESALVNAGVPPKNLLLGRNVSMFKTNKLMDPAGIFVNCPYVVSMRPYRKEFIPKVREVTAKYDLTHGEPIDWGFDGAARLGIENVAAPDYGDPIELEDGEVPVFWGCGVTPQLAVEMVGHLIEGQVISHAPGSMLVLDVTYDELREYANNSIV